MIATPGRPSYTFFQILISSETIGPVMDKPLSGPLSEYILQTRVQTEMVTIAEKENEKSKER